WTADAAHLLRHRDRIRYDADQIRRVHDVERIVGELEVGGIHLQEANVSYTFSGNAIAGLLEHGLGQVDPGHDTVRWVERRVDARPDPDLEHSVARSAPHALNSLH